MTLVLIFIVVQIIVAGIVIAVLNNKLKKELIEAALENLQANLPSATHAQVRVISAAELDAPIKARIENMMKRKAPNASVLFETDLVLKSGLVIHVGDMVLDFSLSERLKKLVA